MEQINPAGAVLLGRAADDVIAERVESQAWVRLAKRALTDPSTTVQHIKFTSAMQGIGDGHVVLQFGFPDGVREDIVLSPDVLEVMAMAAVEVITDQNSDAGVKLVTRLADIVDKTIAEKRKAQRAAA